MFFFLFFPPSKIHFNNRLPPPANKSLSSLERPIGSGFKGLPVVAEQLLVGLHLVLLRKLLRLIQQTHFSLDFKQGCESWNYLTDPDPRIPSEDSNVLVFGVKKNSGYRATFLLLG